MWRFNYSACEQRPLQFKIDKLEGSAANAAPQARRKVLIRPELFPEIMAGLDHSDRRIRLRCADIAEKVTASDPGLLQSFASLLLELARTPHEPEIQWHLAQMPSAPQL